MDKLFSNQCKDSNYAQESFSVFETLVQKESFPESRIYEMKHGNFVNGTIQCIMHTAKYIR